MMLGKDTIQSGWNKQKLVSRSTCEAELVGADNASTKILCTKMFLEAQGYEVRENILNQDNKSTILLLNNGKASSWKCMGVVNIQYFFLHNQQLKGNVEVKYCPTGEMIGDFMTKPLRGCDFTNFWNFVMEDG